MLYNVLIKFTDRLNQTKPNDLQRISFMFKTTTPATFLNAKIELYFS